ncbi:MAG TPA: hypothetical protein VN906_11875 [Candidatus Sulfotelmatobacter sp.]|nr:hypothetical protein [Candidatus Sulfotelmatobacter sp.]
MVPASFTDARHAAHIAGRFRDLQGLRQAVAGVGLLMLFASELVLPMSRPDARAAGVGVLLWVAGVLVVGFAVVIVAIRWVNAWYRRHYGQVDLTRRQKLLGSVIGGGGALAFLVPFQIDALAQNSGQVPPVNLILFTMALWIIGYWFYLGRPYWHYVLIGGIGFVLGIASIAGIPPSTFAWHVREATLYVALASIAGGVVDHMILTRTLHRSESSVDLEP